MGISRPIVIDAPSNLGLSRPPDGREPGCRRMASALRAAGLLAAIDAEDGGAVQAPPYRDDHTTMAGVRRAADIAAYTVLLADRVEGSVAAGRFPLVVGGDCSILLGAMLGLRRLGRYGLVFMDGHLDFRHPGNARQVGAAAGEDLALVTGRGQADLTDLEGQRPLVRDDDVVALGFHEGPTEADAVDILDTEIALMPAESVRREGAQLVARRALSHLSGRPLDGIWIHVDVDVLDSELMPAVDSPGRGGLSWAQFEATLGELARSPLAAGIELTIFDPDLDPDGRLARRLVQALGAVFGQPSAPDHST